MSTWSAVKHAVMYVESMEHGNTNMTVDNFITDSNPMSGCSMFKQIPTKLNGHTCNTQMVPLMAIPCGKANSMTQHTLYLQEMHMLIWIPYTASVSLDRTH